MEPLGNSPERFGPFILLKLLGAGGMGSAYLALHADTQQLLVVKRMHPELIREETIFKRFVHEAEVATHVRHPNVAALVAMGTIDKEPFLATEYVFGIQWSRIVDRVEESLIDPVPLGIALHLSVELISGVQAVHEARHLETGARLGLIHRDVGARNVLIGFDGRVRLIDLGLGKSILSDWQTAHEVLAGSPDYMPPEQAMGAVVDGRADVYASAVTIWEMLAGRKRIREDSVPARLQRALGAQPEPLLVHRPDATVRLETLLKAAMHADPDRRTTTARLFKRALAEEALSVARKMTRADIIAWLDAACATIIARDKRALDEVKELAKQVLEPAKRPMTRLFAGRESLSVPSGYQFYQAPAAAAEELEIVRAGAKSSSLARLAALADPRGLLRAPLEVRIALFAGIGLLLILIGTVVVVTLTSSREDVTAVALPAVRPTQPVEEGDEVPLVAPPPYRTPPPPPPDPPPPPEPPVETKVRPPPPDRAGLSPEVLLRKKRMIGRIRELRRVSFEIEWQARLTRLSARLSRARSEEALDDLEVAIRRMERSR